MQLKLSLLGATALLFLSANALDARAKREEKVLIPLCNVQRWAAADVRDIIQAATKLGGPYYLNPGPRTCGRILCSDTGGAAIHLCNDVSIADIISWQGKN